MQLPPIILTMRPVYYSASYTYDANGNRATKSLGGTTETYNYSNCDELTSIAQGRPGKWEPKINENGGLGGQWSWSWDNTGRHWDGKDGRGNNYYLEEDGRWIERGQQHNLGRPGLKTKPKPGVSSAGISMLGRLSLLLGLLAIPGNANALPCYDMVHPIGTCSHCGRKTPIGLLGVKSE